MKRFFALILAALLIVQLAACGKEPGNTSEAETTLPASTESKTTAASLTEQPSTEEPATEETTEAEPDPMDEYIDSEFVRMVLGHYTYGRDYESLYDSYGRDVTIDDVTEDPETGFAYIEADGERYLLGLDFLSMAMIYNTEPTGSYKTEDEVYAAWWRLYVARWNYLMPEIPLYTNDYYCVYNKKLGGVKEHPVTASWGVMDALVEWTSSDSSIRISSTTAPTGQFRDASYGNTATNSADKDICKLVNGLETVSRTKNAGYVWNDTVVKSHSEMLNEDGSMTYTVTLCDDLKFSDGSRITAKDYLAFPMAFYSKMAEAASGRQNSGTIFAGWDDYVAYTGPGSEKGSKIFAGLHLIDELTFSLTLRKEYIPSFYDLAMISLQPYYAAMWLGEAGIHDDGEGCYLDDVFYSKKDDGSYVMAAKINEAATDTSGRAYAEYPFSGPYFVYSFNADSGETVLMKNMFYKGNYEGTQPSISKVTLTQLPVEREMIELQDGNLDFAGGISGKSAIEDAVSTANKEADLETISYRRAGYGKIGFRCDFGPSQFTEVRQALAYLLDRAAIAKAYTGGYGSLVDGPYYEGSWMYKLAQQQGMALNAYALNEEKAIELLEDGGWIYNAEGLIYSEGVRYKKIPVEIMSEYDRELMTPDGAYKVTRVGDYCYMPLILNWFGCEGDFADYFEPYMDKLDSLERCGFAVSHELGTIETLQEELFQKALFGGDGGIPTFDAFIFSTKLDSPMYDYSFNLTIDPDMYDNYSCYFLKDEADIHWLREIPKNED